MKTSTYSTEIAAVVKQFLDEDDWNYSFDENNGTFSFGLSIKSKITKIQYVIRVKEDELLFYGVSPIGADCDDSKMMAQMAEFICRANYGLKNGSFELDFSDGEVRYKIFVDCDGQLPTTKIVRNSIYCISRMYRRYAEGIVDIIFTGCSAKDAIEKCEKGPEEELRSLLSDLSGSDGGDIAEMLARMAERLGLSESDDDADSETPTQDPE